MQIRARDTEGTRSSVTVPSRFAAALHHFFRTNFITASPPEPLSSGTDCIQLGKGSDAANVQRLLDQWTTSQTPAAPAKASRPARRRSKAPRDAAQA